MTYQYELIKNAIKKNGFLVLNHTTEFPNVMDIGGDWYTVLQLIEERHIFACKLIKGRTTYLSKQLYYALKSFIQSDILTEQEEKIYSFIETNKDVNTKILKFALNLDSKSFKKALDKMQKNLLITVLHGDQSLTKSWSTYCWGTFSQWEETDPHPIVVKSEGAFNEVKKFLSPYLTEKQMKNLLRQQK